MATETGWMTELPQAGTYWLRSVCDLANAVVVVILGNRIKFTNGDSEKFSPKAGYEFLGPLSPSDAEELRDLRKMAQTSLDLLNDVYNSRASQRFSTIGLSRIQSHMKELRAVLTPQKDKERE